ncbi:hypothetical protein C8Q76DRAFT_790946 [Earliella scabrosa]|nr:hypothetical protein C8Q76DRAFT_804426 [Earliella scabrosa]KAI0740501.1 hypothetical protein C8Q76DRAFT_790946 [Earliella scabrosa]
MAHAAPVKLFYTAPCETVFAFGTDSAEDDDYALKPVQVFLVELMDPVSLLLCTVVDKGDAVTFRSLEVTHEGVSSLRQLAPTMLSMRLPYFGIFISFEMQEILEEFKTALNEWFDAKGTVDPAGQPEPGTRPTVTGPAIGGVPNER